MGKLLLLHVQFRGFDDEVRSDVAGGRLNFAATSYISSLVSGTLYGKTCGTKVRCAMTPVITKEELSEYLAEVFSQVWSQFEILEMDGRFTVMRLKVSDGHVRPGGTISGPSMFGLADVAAYVVTLAVVGRKALAVTTSCSIDFMRKPEAGKDLIARAELLKHGKVLTVTDVRIFSEGSDKMVARASLTYSVPPSR